MLELKLLITSHKGLSSNYFKEKLKHSLDTRRLIKSFFFVNELHQCKNIVNSFK
jgi:hypothetical protein